MLLFFIGLLLGLSTHFVFEMSYINKLIAVDNIADESRDDPDEATNTTTSTDLPQVFNFMKEFKCREGGNTSVPRVLENDGKGKVVVDVGLDDGLEFFAALAKGFSVYGFEANPLTIEKLRKKCEQHKPQKCVLVDAADIKDPLPPIPSGGYLIAGGAGSTRTSMSMSLAGPGSSFVEVAPTVRDLEKAQYRNVTIIPIADVVDVDVFFFKIDAQGFEFEILKGAQNLFQNHTVKTLMMEVYPRGLAHAGVDFLEFLNFTWYDLGLFCSTTETRGFALDHSNSFEKFSQYLQSLSGAKWWGKFDDFYCFNRKKYWVHRRRLLSTTNN